MTMMMMSSFTHMLPVAWTPFLDPINFFQSWWFLLALPLAFFISMIYKAMRNRLPRLYWRQVLIMTLQILLGMAALMVGLFVFVQYVAPLM